MQNHRGTSNNPKFEMKTVMSIKLETLNKKGVKIFF
jgi:hypothetical protein